MMASRFEHLLSLRSGGDDATRPRPPFSDELRLRRAHLLAVLRRERNRRMAKWLADQAIHNVVIHRNKMSERAQRRWWRALNWLGRTLERLEGSDGTR